MNNNPYPVPAVNVGQAQPITINAVSQQTEQDYNSFVDKTSGAMLALGVSTVLNSLLAPQQTEARIFQVLPVVLSDLEEPVKRKIYHEFDPAIAAVNPLWNMPPDILLRRFEMAWTWKRHGVSQLAENVGLQTKPGQLTWVQKNGHMLVMLRNTLLQDALVGLRLAPDTWTRAAMNNREQYGLMDTAAAQILAYDVATACLGNLSDHPVAELVQHTRAWLESRMGGFMNTIIYPTQIAESFKLLNSYNNYSNAGQTALAVRGSDPSQASPALFHEAPSDILPVPVETNWQELKHKDRAGLEPTLLTTPAVVGEYYLVGSREKPSDPRWGPWCEQIQLHNKRDQRKFTLSLGQIVRDAPNLFSGPGGYMKSIKNLPLLKSGHELEEGTDGAPDMFMDAEGNPIKLVGQMHPDVLPDEFLSDVGVRISRSLDLGADIQIVKSFVLTHISAQGNANGRNLPTGEVALIAALERITSKLSGSFATSLFLHGSDLPPWNTWPQNVAAVANAFFPPTEFLPSIDVGGRQGQPWVRYELEVFGSNPARPAIAAGQAAQGNAAAIPARAAGYDPANNLGFFANTDIGKSMLKKAGHVKAYQKASGDNSVSYSFGNEANVNAENVKLTRLNDSIRIWAGLQPIGPPPYGPALVGPAPALQLDRYNALAASYDALVDRAFPAPMANPRQNADAAEDVDIVVAYRSQFYGSNDAQLADDANTFQAIAIINPHDLSLIESEAEVTDLIQNHGQFGDIWRGSILVASAAPYSARISTIHSASISQHHDVPQVVARLMEKGISIPSIGAPIPGSVFTYRPPQHFNLPNLGNDLVALTSTELRERSRRISDMSDDSSKLIAILYAGSPVTKDTFLRWSSASIPLPFAAIVFRPNILHDFYSVICCARGERDLGRVRLVKPIISEADNNTFWGKQQRLDWFSAPDIDFPNRVAFVSKFQIRAYLFGKSDGWMDPEKYLQGEYRGKRDTFPSMMAHLIPLVSLSRIPNPLSMSGSMSDQPMIQEQRSDSINDSYIPGTNRLRAQLGTKHLVDPDSPHYQQGNNSICFEGNYGFWRSQNQLEIQPGTGHFKSMDFAEPRYKASSMLAQ